MHTVLKFLADEPLLLLFVLFAIGSLLGAVRVAGVSLGPAAVLFGAIGLGCLATANDIKLTVSPEVGTLGLALFTYTVGVMSGPSFFSTLRKGVAPILSMVGILGLVAVVAATVGRMLDLNAATIAGTFAGALTNTPALAAASERAGDAAAPTIGYSIAYLFGVIGMLTAASIALRRRGNDTDGVQPLVNLTVRVEREDCPRVDDILRAHPHEVTFSRVRHGEDSPLLVADAEEILRQGDLVTVVGPRDVVDKVATELGHASSHTLVTDRADLDFRRITLSKAGLSGRTLGSIELHERFGATVTRVRRGDADMLADDDFVLQTGDRLRVIAPAARMKEISSYLGDSMRGLSDINPVGFAIGMTLGVLLGTVHVALPGGGFEIGSAAGTLVVGLIFGRLGRVGPLVTSVPHAAAAALSQFGMLAFLAYAGTKAGALFSDAVSSDEGWRIAVLGLILTTSVAALMLVTMLSVFRQGGTKVAGILGGCQTQPAVLAFANDRTAFDSRVALGYALVYPAAMIAKILLAQILVG